MNESLDTGFMQRAIALAEKSRLIAPPNPWVGCIIVKKDRIIGEGYTQPVGEAHAEICALQQAGRQAEGATVYVSLEPCAHHGRTPPCIEALKKAKVARVVTALEDPDPKVSGKGIAYLRQQGILVDIGCCAREASLSLEPYLHHRKTGRPFCILKAATSLDGRIAAQDGTSKWITSEDAREDVQRLRAESQAILIGAHTANQDKPSLILRSKEYSGIKQPLRVILDSQGIVKPVGPLFNTELADTLILTSRASSSVIAGWEATGVQVECVNPSEKGDGLDLGSILDVLGKKGVLQLLVEGGAAIFTSFLKAQLVDKLKVYIGPKIIGVHGLPLFADEEVHTLEQAKNLRLLDIEQFTDTVCLTYRISTKF